nr:hypothetical protein [Tanacetum cinerariifolium]
MESLKVIAPGIFKLNVSQCVSPISMSKSSCDSKNVEIKLKRKRRKRKSSKQNVKQVDNDVSRANNDFVHFSELDTFSSVRRHRHRDVIWKKKGSSNTSNVGLSDVIVSNLNKNVKRYSRKDLLACNNSHLGETSSAYMCNDAMNVSCDSRINDLLDDNNFIIFDDVNVRISPITKMPFRKKPRDSMHIVQICLWIIDSGCSKHMTDLVIGSMTIKKVYYVEGLGHNLFSVGQFCDKGLEVAFRKSTCFVRNEDGVDLLTGDRSSNLYTITLNEAASNSSTCLPKMKFEKDHLCSACEQEKIHQKHHKSKTAFASNKPLYLLHTDLCGPMRVQSINGNRYLLVFVDDYSRYTWVFFLYSKDEASEVITSFIKKTQVNLQLQFQRVRTDNGTEFKNKTLAKFFDEKTQVNLQLQVQRVRTDNDTEFKNKTLAKFFDEDVGKLKEKGDIGVFIGYSKESAAFRIYNKQTRKIHESVNVNFDEISQMASKQFSLEPGLFNLIKTGKSSNPSVLNVDEASKNDL